MQESRDMVMEVQTIGGNAMNILELDSLNTMLGKSVVVDRCCVGHLVDMTLEQNMNGVKIHLEIAPTPDTIRKIEEYSKIMGVMAGKNC